MPQHGVMLHLACTLEKSPRVEQRKFARVELGAPVSVRSREGGRETGMIENLSAGGCAINAPGTFLVGARMFVTIANFQSFAGKVVWRNEDGRFGIEFDTPLHPAIVDHIARSNP
ncbi:PilZ domain-containing protein [Sphingomonas panacisoli]|uniref:PilZ domain-containing protein n=1 Tax=Sphingomonas panacisoli TaxID=1813879 RepID=A0A5B8LDI7_9SPHN|nr:PilZ domain-containing protein [Sphingomonas panacisoli]QDZ06211.1 PilZ domain-containing protein [Sphingomonas panacisoli]